MAGGPGGGGLPPPGAGAFGVGALHVRCGTTGAPQPFNTMQAFPIETELFSGRMLLLFRPRPPGKGAAQRAAPQQQAAASAPASAGAGEQQQGGGAAADAAAAAGEAAQAQVAAAFRGKQRCSWIVLQGRFKRGGVGLDALKLGSQFERPFRLPAPLLLTPALTFLASRLGGGISIDVASARPFAAAPLCAAAQLMHVAAPGEEPGDLLAAVEDTRLLLGGTAPLTAAKRRAHFRSAAARGALAYSPDHVYTWHLWDSAIDFERFALAVVGVDGVKVLDGQCMPYTIKDHASGACIVDMQIWHRRMLDHAAAGEAAAAAVRAAAAAAGKAAGGGGSRGGRGTTGGGARGRTEGGGEEEVTWHDAVEAAWEEVDAVYAEVARISAGGAAGCGEEQGAAAAPAVLSRAASLVRRA